MLDTIIECTFTQRPKIMGGIHDLYSLSGKTAALLPRCLSHFRAIGKVKTRNSQFRGFTRNCGKTSVHLVNGNPFLTINKYCFASIQTRIIFGMGVVILHLDGHHLSILASLCTTISTLKMTINSSPFSPHIGLFVAKPLCKLIMTRHQSPHKNRLQWKDYRN